LNFEICRQNLDDMLTVHEGRVCQTILDLYNKDAIVAEPAGALALASLDQYRDKIKGKNVVVLISGSNNDITRTAEIRERALLYRGLKHYFIVRFLYCAFSAASGCFERVCKRHTRTGR